MKKPEMLLGYPADLKSGTPLAGGWTRIGRCSSWPKNPGPVNHL